jgi:hypothetical protein
VGGLGCLLVVRVQDGDTLSDGGVVDGAVLGFEAKASEDALAGQFHELLAGKWTSWPSAPTRNSARTTTNPV